ncbi:MAG TPA: beta-propeller fold lactonase family protein [Solirubrobacterales bacterium]|nr:beta-propeller fold lactonase family protein [Solirubrobacterales bacterium]
MTITESSLRRRVPLIAALAALTLCLCAPQALARYVYTGNYETDDVSVIDTATNQVVAGPIPVGIDPSTLAITPDGKTLIVGAEGGDNLTIIDTQSNQVVTTIPLTFEGVSQEASTIAIAPNGKTAYVLSYSLEGILVLDLQTNQIVGSPIPIGPEPWGVAFSPDGSFAYATTLENDEIVVIDTASRQPVDSIPVGEEPRNVAFAPDGKTAYVVNEEENSVSVIDTQSRAVVGDPILVGDSPWGVAVNPTGSRAYVSNRSDDSVSVIDTQARQVVGGPISIGESPYELAVTPDGKSVYVADYEGESVSVIDTQSNQVATTVPVPGGPWQLAIVPDQSPTASFTAAATKQPLALTFSGLGSTDPDGTIARYDWNFGDGATLAGGDPVPTHSYAKAGAYPVSLTVVDTEGCSVNMVFTGRTAHCSGSTSASAAQTVTVQAPSKVPNKFKFGKLKRNTRKGTAKLTILVPAAGKIVLAGKKVKRAQRSAKKAGKVTVNIRPKPQAKKQLAQKGSAKVRVKVTFSPTGGDQLTKSRSVKLIQR